MTNGVPMPAGKYEWERVVLRLVLPDFHQRLALILSHHASRLAGAQW